MVYLFVSSCGWTVDYTMSLPLSVLYRLLDAKGLRDWSDNIFRVMLSTMSSAPPSEESVESVISSITPDDPWDFLYEGEDYEEDERIIQLEKEFPNDFSHTIKV